MRMTLFIYGASKESKICDFCVVRDAHEREKSCSNESEQMLTCSNGEERSEHIGLGLGLILWNTKTGRVQHNFFDNRVNTAIDKSIQFKRNPPYLSLLIPLHLLLPLRHGC